MRTSAASLSGTPLLPQDRRLSDTENELSRRLSAGADPLEILGELPGLLVEILACPRAAVLALPEVGEGGRPEVFSSAGFSSGLRCGDQVGCMTPDGSLAGYVAALRRPACVVEDLTAADHFPVPDWLARAGVRSAVAARVELAGRPRYVLTALHDAPISRRDEEVARAADFLAHVAARLSAELRARAFADAHAFLSAWMKLQFSLADDLRDAADAGEAAEALAAACVAPAPGFPGGSVADFAAVDLLCGVGPDAAHGTNGHRSGGHRRYAAAGEGLGDASETNAPRLQRKAGPGRVIHTGVREVVPVMHGADVSAVLGESEQLPVPFGGRAPISYMGVPLRAGYAGRRTVGCLSLVSFDPSRVYRDDDPLELWGHVGEALACAVPSAVLLEAQPDEGDTKALDDAARRAIRDLSPRRIQTWNHLARGRTCAEIARLMHIHAQTVYHHRTQLVEPLRPLGVRTGSQVDSVAQRLGPIP